MADLLLDDDSALPLEPTDEETALVRELGPGGILELDRALLAAIQGQWTKTGMVILRALDHLGRFPPPSSAHVAVAARRLIGLVEREKLESAGDLCRPRWSEVRLPDREG